MGCVCDAQIFQSQKHCALKALSKVEVGQVMDFTSDFPVVIERRLALPY